MTERQSLIGEGTKVASTLFHDFYLNLVRDIETTKKAGERYLTVREIAAKFKVSLQTAQKGVTRLSKEGIVTSRPRSGIIVNSTSGQPISPSGKQVLVLSQKGDRWFYTSFLDGVKDSVSGNDVTVRFMVNEFSPVTSIGFGEYLLSLGADGIVALAFDHSALPFYYAMERGQDIVSDIILDDLPTLPAVQTGNYSHAFDAGSILGGHKLPRYYMIGYEHTERNRRWSGFCDGVRKGWTGAALPRISYICLSDDNAIGTVLDCLMRHSEDAGFFIGDWSANYLFGALCLQEGLQPSVALVYDADDAYFCLQGLEPIRVVAPPFHELGRRLGAMLLSKWQKGKWDEPLQVKI